MAKRIKAVHYIECSARTSKNLESVFIAAADVALSNKKKGFLKGMMHLHSVHAVLQCPPLHVCPVLNYQLLLLYRSRKGSIRS